MRRIRAVAITALVAKMLVLGAWWRSAAAKSEAPAADAGVPGDLFARSRGFRDLLEAVRQRSRDLDEREQALAAREGALKSVEKTLADEITRLESLAGSGACGAGAREDLRDDEARGGGADPRPPRRSDAHREPTR